eukprot:TRINITY_DN13937_c0_g1_i1.p1 TRINITY_DN13937_c0_g1~~TRINITY_DN13937_c0_g1_i1.p1  ORF type:complete len:439 (+),score=149.05 TRINITY_DN13937_c0_g1_i1:90-1406(+)
MASFLDLSKPRFLTPDSQPLNSPNQHRYLPKEKLAKAQSQIKFEARKSIRFSTPSTPSTIEKEHHSPLRNLVRFHDDSGITGDDHQNQFVYQYPVDVGGKRKLTRQKHLSSPALMRNSGELVILRAPSIRKIEVELAPIAESSEVVEIIKPTVGNGISEYVKLISQGTYGIVWEAIDEVHQTVAVKIQTPGTREQKNAILQEIDLHEHMCHQNPKVVQLFRKFELASDHFMIMERMTCSLACVDLPLSETEVSAVLFDTLEALLAIHKEGICHRDIKPDNLMLSNDGIVKICDFGLSAFDGDSAQLAGTMVYLAPEVAEEYLFRSDKPTLKASFALDIWALGITAAELATSRVPFEDADVTVMSKSIYELPAYRLPDYENYSSELRDFVSCCLQKDPSQRADVKTLLQHPFLSNKDGIEWGKKALKVRSEKYRTSVRR